MKVLEEYFRVKKFHKIYPFNGYEKWQLGNMVVAVDQKKKDYLIVRVDVLDEGNYEDEFQLVLKIEKYRIIMLNETDYEKNNR
jgi:hypothetical protein